MIGFGLAEDFTWIEEGKIAGCRGPQSDEDLAFLREVGVSSLVRLEYNEGTGMTPERVRAAGLEDCYEPVTDGTAPSQEQIDRVLRFAKKAIARGNAVAVSCWAGCGRTGTILVCYLIASGLNTTAAVNLLRSRRPCCKEAWETPVQKAAIQKFARRFAEGGVNLH